MDSQVQLGQPFLGERELEGVVLRLDLGVLIGVGIRLALLGVAKRELERVGATRPLGETALDLMPYLERTAFDLGLGFI